MVMRKILYLVVVLLLWTAPAHAVRIGLDGNGRFTLDGVPTFLLGVSYFDALDWKISDLDGLQSRGFNLMRVFADWRTVEDQSTQTIFDASGALIPAREAVLRNLIQAANARGIVVDVTVLLSYTAFQSGTPLISFNSPNARRAAVQNAISAFANEPNVFFDLVNEHEQGEFTDGHDEIATLISDARSRSASAIVFVSGAGDHHISGESPITSTINEEVSAGIQVLAPHNPRTQDWWRLTQSRAAAYRSYLTNTLGRPDIPVYFQEENRHGFTWASSADEFIAAAVGCRTGGCAAWILHTEAGFNLSNNTFFGRLNAVEQDIVGRIAASVLNRTAPSTPTGLRITAFPSK